MSKRMLIDGAHPEEIRVVVTSGNRLEEYDIETVFKKQVKGNIYLAKVTRVEPSLQAAFVDFGGNRHGFLAFNEIHPDYYQIPIEDRQALIEEQEALELKARAAQEHLEDIDGDQGEAISDRSDVTVDDGRDDGSDSEIEIKNVSTSNTVSKVIEGLQEDTDLEFKAPIEQSSPRDRQTGNEESEQEALNLNPDIDASLEATEVTPPKNKRGIRRYKIQEVIKRRQILLVQVVKEERGNKGAALTTYISLAGRYCVLMPNSSRGGGISRKITGSAERRKLRETLNSLDMPKGMGVIIRTAGLERNKAEIKRDFEYLIRAWDEVREKTLQSTAPEMVYEEGDIIKRAIRDLYSKDIDEIQIDGAPIYQNAKRFMRLMMPSHAKRVRRYRDEAIPLFQRFQIEQQLDGMNHPEVQLKSGGYIVINPTEALVAIDVNSGKFTRERNIEETALKTNIEAADEIARQLRLRDLAGLIVIDFIDMEDGRNVRKVERRLKEAMKLDRARLQIGRISIFGLLELSRQRLRPSLLETSSQICPHCRGTGNVLATESMAMRTLRSIEEEGIRNRSREIKVKVPAEVALYILNKKRAALVRLEELYGFQVILEGDDTVVPPDIDIERVKAQPTHPTNTTAETVVLEQENNVDIDSNSAEPENDEEKSAENKPKRRRRRGRRRSQRTDLPTEANDSEPPVDSDATGVDEDINRPDETSDKGPDKPEPRRRRRGRRGGRRRPSNASADKSEGLVNDEVGESDNTSTPFIHSEEVSSADPSTKNEVDNSLSRNRDKNSDPVTPKHPSASEPVYSQENNSNDIIVDVADGSESQPKRRGWWQKIIE